MGKGRFINQKLGKRVHRGIVQRLGKAQSKDPRERTIPHPGPLGLQQPATQKIEQIDKDDRLTK